MKYIKGLCSTDIFPHVYIVLYIFMAYNISFSSLFISDIVSILILFLPCFPIVLLCQIDFPLKESMKVYLIWSCFSKLADFSVQCVRLSHKPLCAYWRPNTLFKLLYLAYYWNKSNCWIYFLFILQLSSIADESALSFKCETPGPYHISDVFDFIWSFSMSLPNPGHHGYRVGVTFWRLLLDDLLLSTVFLSLALRLAILCLFLRVTRRGGATVWWGSWVVIWRFQVFWIHGGLILFSLHASFLCLLLFFETGYCEGPAVLARSVKREWII